MKNNIKIDKDLKKILIIGANGFLGSYLLQSKNEGKSTNQKYFIIASDLTNTNIERGIPFYRIDITKSKETIKRIVELAPDIVILTAAMTDVDQCEIDKDLAIKVNLEGPKNVLKACEIIHSKLIFISTDFVFDGTKVDGFYIERDIPNPLSHYAKIKYEAELALNNSNIESLICRTAVLYGWYKPRLNYITWILTKLQQKEKISIVTTQINSPTFVRNLAEIILKLIEKEATGIYHTVGDCALNRYEMALKCAKIFNYDSELIVPVSEFKQKAVRPKNAGLDISKLKNLIGPELKIYNLDDGLNYMKNHRLT